MNKDASYEYWRRICGTKKEKNIRWRYFGHTSDHDWDTGPYKKSMDCIPILDGGYVALLDHMGTDIDIVNSARKSFGDESSSFGEKDRKLLKYLWKHRHTSPFEMIEFKFAVKAPLFIARQWMRHRNWSYNEVSRRYTDENIDFYCPDEMWLRAQSEIDRQASVEMDGGFTFLDSMVFDSVSSNSEGQYRDLLKRGVCREQARMVLPQSMYVEFFAKTDLSNLLHFLDLRMDPHAQWEIQQYSEAIVEMIQNIVPETMDIFLEDKRAKEINS